MPQHDSAAWNTMLGAYIQSNCLVQARELFTAMPVRDTASWNAILAASTQRGNLLQVGKIFSTLPDRSIVSWNAMIHGCAQNGHERKAAEFFGSMAMEGAARNEISFQAILLTCNHGGKLRVALDYFRSMVAEYNISPNVIHFQAMADVLGRAGLVAEAEGLLLVMPFQPHFLAWKSLISACKVHGSGKNIDAARAAEKLLEMKPGDSSALRAHVESAKAATSHESIWQNVQEIVKSLPVRRDDVAFTTLINVAGDWKRPY
ncbi:pentatricopeptide repeat-containing protein At2g22070-like [Selaginella moellendorffii]|uniref:pentatricopeptide repeat-containing protein At2g22070-like n=1 Tax=Selaginella moellendorffii TaxID=88036 RepID=UPI000D1C331F|nr:pentatricopeptide repeat-containing protein At2g22070-like [Selaginella moellendorffii]|eukprot:XP_024517035.1 pentatricopeptide repeat-containing protein At2g22070-like [Selaginella moellendorffii]